MTSVSSDMKQILGVISDKKGEAKQAALKKRKRETLKTVPRASLYPTSKPVFKKRQKSDVHWKWENIRSSAREDESGVNHWVRFNATDYRYARFNKPIKLLQYTDEEYDKYVQLDGRWTRRETDLLMKLCKAFDLRFVVIHDRYSIQKDANCAERTVEDLKDRFYTIQRSLLQAREPSKKLSNHAMFSKAYNKSQEKERKTQLEKLFRRTKRQEKEMTHLVSEHRKYAQALKKKKNEKKARKKAERDRQEAMKTVHDAPIRIGANRIGRTATADSNAQIEQLRASLPSNVIPRNPFTTRANGVTLRQQDPRLPLQLTDTEQLFVSNELGKLGFDKEVPLTVPTKQCCGIWDQIRVDITTLYNLEKLVKTKEAQTEALKKRVNDQMMKQNMLRQSM